MESIAEKVTRNLKVDKDRTSLPALEELCESIIKSAGGKEAFAQKLWDTFDKSKPGSQVRARICQSTLDFLKVVSDRGKLDVNDNDAAAMTDADLDAYVKQIVKETMQKTDG